MTCYNPIRACYSKSDYAKTGKKNIHLCYHETYDSNNKVIKDSKYLLNEKSFPHALYEYINIPCRVCAGCRSDNAKMWSLRAYHELVTSDKACFITLTYDNASDLVVSDPLCVGSLRYKHFQNFIKRLRKSYPDNDISYIVSGEYGLKDGRAHWHAILYGIDFRDERELVYVKKGFNHYSCESLDRLWSTYDKRTDTYNQIGFTDLCDVDYDCCAYVAGYVLKKLPVGNVGISVGHLFEDDDIKDIRLDSDGRCPPIIRSSKRPAIGYRWYQRYGKNSCEKGFAMVPKGDKKMKVRTPSYYFSKLETQDNELFTILKEKKEQKMKKYYEKNPVDLEKLHTWEQSHLYRIKNKLKDVLTIFKK